MGSLSVAYYTIAPISLDLLRPALLSETKNTRCGRSGRLCSDVDGLKDRYSAIELQTHIACSKSKAPQASQTQGTGYPGGDQPQACDLSANGGNSYADER